MIATLTALVTSLAAWRWPTMSPRYMQTTPLPDALLLLQTPSLADQHARLEATIAALEIDNNATNNDSNTTTTNTTNNVSDVRSFLQDVALSAMVSFSVRSVGLAVVDLDDSGSESTLAVAMAQNGEMLDPSKMLYRIASVTKSMTATAVLMLVQSGHIKSVNDSVDQYLDPELRYGTEDTAFGGPITLHHLLTHTAGFAESVTAQLVDDKELLPLRTYLIRVRPPRVYPVGAVPAYSNFGFGLLGRVIERLANQSYEAFMRERLFTPLGMHQSVISPRDPALNGSAYWSRLAPEWAPDQLNPAGLGVEMGTYVFQFAPAGSVLLTVDDMARYARFHLTRGQLPDGTQLLDVALVDAMHSAFQFSPFGIGYGFLRLMIGTNTTSLQHDGDMPTASSRLLIIPSHKRAIFISLGKGAVPVRDLMTKNYGSRFCVRNGYAFEPPEHVSEFPADRPLVDGLYTYTRTTHGGCLDFYYRTFTPEVELVGRGRTVGVGEPFSVSSINYALRDSTEKYVYWQTQRWSAGLFGFPFLVASPVGARSDGRAQYVTLSDPTAAYFIDPIGSFSARYTLVVLSAAFVALMMALLMASCAVHQCCGKQLFERDYSEKWRSKRAYHDAAVYCYAPMQFIMFVVIIVNYTWTAAELMSSFATVGAFVFFPYAFAVCAAFGILFAVGACAFRVWWLDRRILFAILQISFVVFAIVWGALGGGYHTHCWNTSE